jgi:hypothetical protein
MLYNINVSKINELVVFDTDKLPESSIQYVMEYGFRKSINDAHAAVKREAYEAGDKGQALWVAEVRKVAFQRVDQILTGTTPRASGTVSPVLVAAAKAGLSEAQVLALIEGATKNKRAA